MALLSRGRPPGRRWPLFAGLGLLLLGAGVANAQTPVPLEYRVKAAYLMNFTRYVEWPADAFESPSSPIRLCVLGSDPFGPALAEAAASRTSHGRPIEVRLVGSAGAARECHAVFITYQEWRRRPDVLLALREHGVLTIGEGAEFAEQGGVLSFVIVGESVRFVVNLAARDRAGLGISSRMLALATELFGRERRPQP